MNTRTVPRTLSVLLVLSPVLLACGLLNQPTQPAQAPPIQVPPTQVPLTQASYPSPTTAAVGAAPIHQWAADAEASSEWDAPDWSVKQVTGAPNTPECGDYPTAWASAGRDAVEWINVYYDVPVYPTEIRIIQTYAPDQVSQVDLIDMQGNFVTVYTKQPEDKSDRPCPYVLAVSVSRGDLLVQGVRITIDQSVLNMDWTEIDAVEIVGVPGQGTPVRPPTLTP